MTAKHPELRPPHDTLNEWENRLLELAYWQGYTYREIDKTFGFSTGWASNKCNLALRKLVYHSLHQDKYKEAGRLEFAHILPDPRLTELEKVQGAQKRIAVARRFPGLRPPYSFLNDQENTILEQYYWQGHTYLQVAQHCGLTQNKVRAVRNTALRKLHREYRRTQAQKAERDIREPEATHTDVTVQAPPLVLGQDARITALRRLGPPDNRRKTAGRYPELRPPHDALNRDDNDLLELALWQGRPYAEIASRKGLTSREVGTGVRGALERLNRHLCRDANDDEDHLDTVLLALNERRSVGRAAKKLRVSKDVLQAFIERAGIKSRIVFEVEA